MTIRLLTAFIDKKQNVIYSETWDNFKTIKEAKEHLKEIYGKNKRTNMFRDGPDGKSIHIGYVYRRWNQYENTRKRFNEEIWVTFYEEKVVNLGERKE